jgi:uncharacterized membrane protein YfcA
MSAAWLAALFGAAFVASAINAVAGGGSLVSFPALLASGLPPVSANVTNSVGLWSGYVGGSWSYRAELADQGRRVRRLALPCVLGALVGVWLLLATPEQVFELLVPFLILAACGVMAAQDRLAAWLDRRRARRRPSAAEADAALAHPGAGLWAATFLLGAYGAYFGAALGIMLLAALGLLLPDDLQRSNALKGLLSLIINAIAVTCFALFGPVAWPAALAMAAGSLAGGWLGAGFARRLGAVWLRRAVIGYGVFVAALLLARMASPS